MPKSKSDRSNRNSSFNKSRSFCSVGVIEVPLFYAPAHPEELVACRLLLHPAAQRLDELSALLLDCIFDVEELVPLTLLLLLELGYLLLQRMLLLDRRCLPGLSLKCPDLCLCLLDRLLCSQVLILCPTVQTILFLLGIPVVLLHGALQRRAGMLVHLGLQVLPLGYRAR